MDIKEVMNRKVAGVPVYILAFVFAAGLLYMAIRMKRTPDMTGVEEGDTADAIGGDVADVQQPVFTANPPTFGSPTGGSVTVLPTADTNERWGRRVTEALLQAGHPYSTVSGMVSKYLSGQSLNSEEAKLRDLAVAQFGLPPEPVDFAPDITDDGGKDEPEGDTPDGPAERQGDPPCMHTVMGKGDDTPVELSRLYYGVNTSASRDGIQSANPDIDWPATVGTRLSIPVYSETPDEPNVPDNPPTGPPPANPPTYPPPPSNPPSNPPSSGGGNDDVSSREKWGRAAKGYLKRQGHDPDRVEKAIDRYLTGLPLTDNQKALVKEAVDKFGKPPSNKNGGPPRKTSTADGLRVIVSEGQNPILTPTIKGGRTIVTPGEQYPVKRL